MNFRINWKTQHELVACCEISCETRNGCGCTSWLQADLSSRKIRPTRPPATYSGHADILTGSPLHATLLHNHTPRLCLLTMPYLDTQALAWRTLLTFRAWSWTQRRQHKLECETRHTRLNRLQKSSEIIKILCNDDLRTTLVACVTLRGGGGEGWSYFKIICWKRRF